MTSLDKPISRLSRPESEDRVNAPHDHRGIDAAIAHVESRNQAQALDSDHLSASTADPGEAQFFRSSNGCLVEGAERLSSPPQEALVADGATKTTTIDMTFIAHDDGECAVCGCAVAHNTSTCRDCDDDRHEREYGVRGDR